MHPVGLTYIFWRSMLWRFGASYSGWQNIFNCIYFSLFWTAHLPQRGTFLHGLEYLNNIYTVGSYYISAGNIIFNYTFSFINLSISWMTELYNIYRKQAFTVLWTGSSVFMFGVPLFLWRVRIKNWK